MLSAAHTSLAAVRHLLDKRLAGARQLERNLYKNVAGDKLVFEEINHDLGLTYRSAWRTSDRFGFVRTTWLHNNLDQPCTVDLVDGVQNLLPYGATAALQTNMSNLLDAYKRSELDSTTGLGIFTLSATLTDRAEPSESLKATAAWQVGLDAPAHLLSNHQLAAFRLGAARRHRKRTSRAVAALICWRHARPGSARRTELEPRRRRQPGPQRCRRAAQPAGAAIAGTLADLLEQDIARGSTELVSLVASADGLQQSADPLTTAHHFANVIIQHYARRHLRRQRPRSIKRTCSTSSAPATAACWTQPSPALPSWPICRALYLLPISMSAPPPLARRTSSASAMSTCRSPSAVAMATPAGPGTSSRSTCANPMAAAVSTTRATGATSFRTGNPWPGPILMFVVGMIAKFLNATTADGYNPYRVMRDGVEWEAPEPRSSLVQHRLLERPPDRLSAKAAGSRRPVPTRTHCRRCSRSRSLAMPTCPTAFAPTPTCCAIRFTRSTFVGSRKPKMAQRTHTLGTDGKLLMTADGQVFHVNLVEKLLVLLLAKLVNLVPEGGIWMNTQRPEWNDANNALVGKGLSVVTVAYLRRFIVFCRRLVAEGGTSQRLTCEVTELLGCRSHRPGAARAFARHWL